MSDSPPEASAPLGLLSAQFRSTEDEHEYRFAHLERDRAQGGTLILILSVALLALGWFDYVFLGADSTFFGLLAARLVVVSASLLIVFARGLRSTVRRMDWAHGGWMMLAYFLTVAGNAAVPAEFGYHIILDVLLVLTVSMVLPLPFWAAAFGAAVFTVAQMAVVTVVGAVDSALVARVWWVSLVYGSTVGLMVANRFHRTSRAEHEALCRERTMLSELDEAMSSIRTLRGLLPQCGTCPGNDFATWEEVEKFILQHTDAHFSHGVCPPCARKLYPDLDLDESAD